MPLFRNGRTRSVPAQPRDTCAGGRRCHSRVNTLKQQEPVYIFHHIPKCGGTSMRAAFGEWFPIIEDYRPEWADGTALEQFRARTVDPERIKPGAMICGHFEVDGVYLEQRYPQAIEAPGFRLITFVREPLQLRLSLLRFEIMHDRIARAPLEDLLLGRPNWISKRFPLAEENLEQVLDRYFFIGLTEHSSAGFDVLADLIGKPRLNLPIKNRSKPAQLPVSPELERAFRETHALDYRLYQHCRDRWEQAQSRTRP